VWMMSAETPTKLARKTSKGFPAVPAEGKYKGTVLFPRHPFCDNAVCGLWSCFTLARNPSQSSRAVKATEIIRQTDKRSDSIRSCGGYLIPGKPELRCLKIEISGKGESVECEIVAGGHGGPSSGSRDKPVYQDGGARPNPCALMHLDQSSDRRWALGRRCVQRALVAGAKVLIIISVGIAHR